MSAPGDFDPYLAWLDIKPMEHPLDHYKLLGVERFEADAKQIEQAADSRMSHVRQFQTGPRGRFTQGLLNDLATAKLCLLNPNAKASYDAVLMGQEAARHASTPLPPPVQDFDVPADSLSAPMQQSNVRPAAEPTPPPVEDSADNVRSPKSVRHFHPTPSRTNRARNVTVVIGIFLLLGLVAGIVFAIVEFKNDASSNSSASHSQDSNSDSDTTGKKKNGESGPSQTPDEPLLIEQEADGSFSFPATLAELHGGNLKRTNKGSDGVITNWSTKDDWISWNVNVKKPGFFKAQLEYATDESSLGSKYEIEIGKWSKQGEVRVGDPPGSFVTDELVLLIERKGSNQLRLRALDIRGEEFLRFRTLKLISR